MNKLHPFRFGLMKFSGGSSRQNWADQGKRARLLRLGACAAAVSSGERSRHEQAQANDHLPVNVLPATLPSATSFKRWACIEYTAISWCAASTSA